LIPGKPTVTTVAWKKGMINGLTVGNPRNAAVVTTVQPSKKAIDELSGMTIAS
jgi:hypothetical protein